MIEEFKEDNNCIVKAFENNPISILTENINNKKIYWFKASDIGKALQLINIRTSIMNYDEDERTVRSTYSSNGGNPDTIYLSSQGVYRLLYNSKKDIAKKFRKWAGNILDDIIFNESQELKKQLEHLKIEIKNKDFQQKIDKHNFLIEKFKNKKCVYISEITENLIKIGSSKDINERFNGLTRTYGNCIFLDIFEHQDYQTVESNILKNVKNHLYKEPINNHISIEVVKLSNTFNYTQLHEIVKYYVNTNNFLSPIELLEKQKLNIIQTLLDKGESLQNILLLINKQNEKEIKENVIIKENIEIENKEVTISKQILNLPVVFKGKKTKRSKNS